MPSQTKGTEPRILDEVMQDVRTSLMERTLKGEEVYMCNVAEAFEKKGLEKGLEKGIKIFILDNQEEGIPRTRVAEKLARRFGISAEQAEEYLVKYNY